jgi:hypothetical protein
MGNDRKLDSANLQKQASDPYCNATLSLTGHKMVWIQTTKQRAHQAMSTRCAPRAVHSMSKQRRVGRGDGPMLVALGDMKRDAPPDNER